MTNFLGVCSWLDRGNSGSFGLCNNRVNAPNVTGYEYSVRNGGTWSSWTAISGANRHTATHTFTAQSNANAVRLRARNPWGAGPSTEFGPVHPSRQLESKLAVSFVLAGGATASAVTEANLNGAQVRMTPKTRSIHASSNFTRTFSWGTGADAGSDVGNFTLSGLAGAGVSGELRPVCVSGSGALKAGCARPASGAYTAPGWRGLRVSYTGNVTSDGTLRIAFTRGSNVLSPAAPGWAEVKVHAQPQPTAVALTSTPGQARGYDVGETIRAAVTFSYPVAVDGTGGTPRLALSVGPRTRYAGYESRRADKLTLTFAYTVVLNDEDGDGVSVAAGALDLNGGSIGRDGVAGAPAVLALGAHALASQAGHRVAAGRTDHDRDDDGLIEVSTPAQLHAVRWDLDGDGTPDAEGGNAPYVGAFALAVSGMGCPSPGGCVGYELAADLDLDVAPYNAGAGWEPIGSGVGESWAKPYNARFRGNGRTISGLTIDRDRNYSGLFGSTGSGARIEGVGLLDPSVPRGQGSVGALVGANAGVVHASYVSGGTVAARTNVGLLVGQNLGVVSDSYAVGGTVQCLRSNGAGGGLVGFQWGGTIRRGYSTVSPAGACPQLGVLVGGGGAGSTVQGGYYDAEATGRSTGGGEGRTTRALKEPVASVGPYAGWSAAVWDFGTVRQYPALRAGGHRAAAQLARQGLSGDASLGSLSVEPGALSPAFAPGTTAYTVAVGHGVARVTVAAAPARSVAGVSFAPAGDADPGAPGRQVAVSEGGNALSVRVVAEDGTVRRYGLEVTRARAPGLVAPGSLGVAEGGSGTYTVALAAAPSGPVAVSVAKVAGGSPDVGVSPPSLAFTAANWDTPQTVTVSAAEDDGDTAADAAVVRHVASGGGYGAVSADLAVSVAENDAPGLVLGAGASLSVPEGGAGAYTVALATQPAGPVAVSVAKAPGGSPDVAVSPSVLAFTALDWRSAQTVTVTAAEDDDAVADTATVRHRASGGGYGSVAAEVAVTVAEGDRAGLRVSAAALEVAEGGSGTYTVALASAPAGTVSVSVARAPGGSPDVAVSPASLTFTALDWNTPQTVTVTAGEDGDAVADAAVLRHRASGGGYGAVAADVAVSVRDDDRAGLVLGRGLLAVPEGGSGTYTVALAAQPAGTVSVSVAKAVGGSPDVGVSPAVLTFTALDWNTPQTVTVRAADDADTDPDAATVLHRAAGGGYAGLGAGLAVRVNENDYAGVDHDDDDDGLIEVSTPAQLHAMRWDLDGDGAADAAGDHGDYTAAFAGAMPGMGCRSTGCEGYELAADLDLDVAPYNTGAGWEPIGATDWRGANPYNARFRGNGRTISGLTIDRYINYSGLFGATGSAARIEGVGVLGPSVSQGRGSVGALVGANNGTVHASYVSGGTVAARTNVGLLVGQNLGVVSDSYAVDGTVECVGTGGGLVGFQWGGAIRRGYSTVSPAGACENHGVLVGTGGTGTVEGGVYDAEATGRGTGGGEGRTTRALKEPVAGTGPYAGWSAAVWDFGTVRQYPALRAGGHRAAAQLARQGRSGDASLGSLSVEPGALSPAFAPGTTAYTVAVGHGVAQVTVAAAPARSVAGVAFAPAGDADPAAPGRQVAVSEGGNALSVRVVAEDGTVRRYGLEVVRARAPGLVAPGSLGVAEGGSGTYTVALAAQPSGPVAVSVAKVAGGSADVGVSPPSLAFTAQNWSTGQTVTVSAAEDDGDTAADAAVVRHVASGGGYDAVTADVAVSVAENDAPGLVVDAAPASAGALEAGPLALAEGGASKAYTVRLATQPQGAVTVTVASADAAAVAVDTDGDTPGDQGALVFGASTWSTGQTVTARAVGDADAEGESVVVSHTAAGGGYAGVAASLAVSVSDDDALTAPANVAAAGGLHVLRVAWDAVPGADGYKVQWRSGDQGYDPAREAVATASPYVIGAPAVVAGTEYTVRVVPTRAGAHDGPASAEARGAPLAPPSLSIDAPRVGEGAAGAGGTLRFTVSLSRAVEQLVTVGYADAGGGSAASGTDYAALAAGTLSFTPGATTRAVEVAVRGDAVDETDETVVVALSAPVNATLGASQGTGTIVDDDGAPSVSIDSPRVAEGAGEALRFTVSLSHAGGQPVTVGYADAGGGSATAGADYTALGAGVLTFAAGETARAVEVAVLDDAVEEADETVVVALSAPVGAALGTPSRGTGTIAGGEPAAPSLVLSPATVAEGGAGSVATVSAALSRAAARAMTLTVRAGAGANAAAGDFALGAADTLAIAAGATVSAGTVTVRAVDDDTDAPDRRVRVWASGAGAVAAEATLVIADDDAAPDVALSVSPPTIAENGGEALVSATLSHPSSEPTTMTVAGVAGAYVAGADARLVIAAGETASGADTATVRGVDNAVDAPPRTVTVRVRLGNAQGAGTVSGAALVLADDDAAPDVALSVWPPAVAEGGGVARVGAALSHPSSEPTTVTVQVSPGANAAPGDFVVSAANTLTIAAGETEGAGTVTVAAVDDAHDSPRKRVVVSGVLGNGQGTGAVVPATLAIDDDDDPRVALVLSAATLAESGAGSEATVSATLDGASGAGTTVTVGVAPGAHAAPGDFTLSAANTLTIAAGATVSTGTVTVAAVDDAHDAPDRQVTVRAAALDNDLGVAAPAEVVLTITDDDPTPDVAITLDPASIAENGGTSAVSATLSHRSSAPTTVTVAAVPGAFTVPPGAAGRIVVAAGATTTTGTVTITAVDNATDEPDRMETVTAALANGAGTGRVAPATLTLTDDEALPVAALALSPAAILENGGVSSVTATLSGASSQAVVLTVAAAPGTGAAAADFDLSAATTLTIAAGRTASTGAVTVTANDNQVTAGGKQVTVSATAAGGNGVADPADATLTLIDDDTPATTLHLSRSSIAEAGGVATVTATLDRASSVAVTVTVAAAPGTNAAVGDFTLGAANTLTFAANATASTGTVTVAAVDDDTDAPDKAVTVSGTAADSLGLARAPSPLTLTIPDDDGPPAVSLALGPDSIAESGGTSTVSATLSYPSSAATTVTITAVPGAFTVPPGAAGYVVIAAGATTATGDTVTVTAVDDGAHQGSAGRMATVTATVANDRAGADFTTMAVTAATLTLTDDDAPPTVALSLSPDSIAESGGTSTVSAVLSHPSSAATTVTITAVPGAFTVPPGAAGYVVIAAGDTTATGDTVTITAVDNATDEPNRRETVTATVANDRAGADSTPMAVTAATLTLTDDDAPPTVALSLSPDSIAENGGTATVSAVLSHPSSAATTVTITAVPGAFTVPPGAAGTIVIAAGATTATGDTVTITAVDNDVDAADNEETVTATVANDRAGADSTTMAVTAATLTLTDDDAPPAVALSLSPDSIAENGGTATVSAVLSHPSSAATTVTITAVPGAFTVPPGAAGRIVVAAGATTTTGTVTVTAVDDRTRQGSAGRMVTVTATVANDRAGADSTTMAVTGAALTLIDDEVIATYKENTGAYRYITGVSGSILAATAGSRSITVGTQGGVQLDGLVEGYACAKTGTPASGNASYLSSGCASFGNFATTHNDGGGVRRWVTSFAVTQAMIDNRGFVLVLRKAFVGDEIVFGQWVPIEVPRMTLALSSSSIAEGGGVATVTATLDRTSTVAVAVTVSASPVPPAVAGDFTLSAAKTLTIAAGQTTSAGTVTVTAVDNDTDAPDKTVTVGAAAANVDPAEVVLTIADDDAAPTVALSLSPDSIAEGGGTSTVSATLSHPSSEPTTVTVTAVANVYTVAEGAGATIVIAAGDTTAAGDTATITAVDNAVDAADNEVTVAAVAGNGHGVGAVTEVALTITDDDTAGLSVSPATSTASRLRTTEAGGTDTFTVALATEPTGDVVLDVASSDTDEGTVDTDADTTGDQGALTFTAATWDTAQTVTLTGQDDSDTDGSQDYTVTLVVNQADTADAVYDALGTVSVYALNADDEVTADVNEDGTVDRNDALVLFYVYDFGPDLKDSAILRDAALRPRKGALAENDASYLRMITNAESWATAAPTGSDLNASGSVDRDDALVMFYVYDFGPDLKDSAILRDAALRPRKGTLAESDASYLQMITDAERLAGGP